MSERDALQQRVQMLETENDQVSSRAVCIYFMPLHFSSLFVAQACCYRLCYYYFLAIFRYFFNCFKVWKCNLVNLCDVLSLHVFQWRQKLRSQQYERERELSDHAVVIKELQKVIGDERLAKEQLENQV